MIRYALAALALKAFSINGATRHAYRKVGNLLGAKRRERTDLGAYVGRARLLLDLYQRHGDLQKGSHILELGSGWMHWYAVYISLFHDVHATTFDVWDNRQFRAFKACFSRLRQQLARDPVSPEVIDRLDRVLALNRFEEIYSLLNMRNLIVPDGSLSQLPDAHFSSVFSMHVMEHVPRQNVSEVIADMFRIIKPGGITIHQIGIDDHLAHYDPAASPKQYLSYSNRTWSMLFENQIQYINKLQMSDWIREFERAGFVVVDNIAKGIVDIRGLEVSEEFRTYSEDDLACANLTIVCRRPSAHC
jgi:hypothetical protein